MSKGRLFLVGGLEFEWDRSKAASNLEKHKISFEEGATVFEDEFATVLDDPDRFEDEVRFVLIGYSYARRMLAVVHIERGVRIRMISVRAATRSERRVYEEKRQG